MILETTTNISDKRRWLEITAVVATAIGKFVFMDTLNWRFPFVATAVLAWATYIYYRIKLFPALGSYWGFRRDNYKRSMNLLLPFAIVAIIAFLIVGWFLKTLNPTWHIFPILISYPIWGTIQQFLIIALVAGNLKDMKSLSLPKPVIIIFTAILFSMVHYPINWLMIGTFLLALVYGVVYFKSKNLYVLGIFHGWLGALFYYTVLGSDPFAEIFLKMF